MKNEYFDENVQRAVSGLQNVINMGRIVRDSKNIPLKMPLRELVVIHPDSVFLNDLEELKSYIQEVLFPLMIGVECSNLDFDTR